METAEKKIRTISFSEISSHQACSLKHQLKYRDKIESRETDQALALGSAIHSAIDTCLKHYQVNDRLMNIVELQKIFTEVLSHQAREKKIKFKEGWTMERLDRLGRNLINAWLAGFRRNCGAVLSLETEKTFVVPLPDPDGNPSEYHVKGIIDAIFHMQTINLHNYESLELADRFFGPHKYAIVDWKTYLNVPNKPQLERAIQNAIYVWGAYQSGLIPNIKQTSAFLGVLHKTKTPVFKAYRTQISDNLIKQALKIFYNTAMEIDLGVVSPNFTNSIACSACEYFDNFCEAWN